MESQRFFELTLVNRTYPYLSVCVRLATLPETYVSVFPPIGGIRKYGCQRCAKMKKVYRKRYSFLPHYLSEFPILPADPVRESEMDPQQVPEVLIDPAEPEKAMAPEGYGSGKDLEKAMAPADKSHGPTGLSSLSNIGKKERGADPVPNVGSSEALPPPVNPEPLCDKEHRIAALQEILRRCPPPGPGPAGRVELQAPELVPPVRPARPLETPRRGPGGLPGTHVVLGVAG